MISWAVCFSFVTFLRVFVSPRQFLDTVSIADWEKNSVATSVASFKFIEVAHYTQFKPRMYAFVKNASLVHKWNSIVYTGTTDNVMSKNMIYCCGFWRPEMLDVLCKL